MRGSIGFSGYPVSSSHHAGRLCTAATSPASSLAASSARRSPCFSPAGVLIDLGGVEEFRELIGVRNTDEIWRRWLISPWVRRYERGQCTREEFAVGIVVEL